MSERIVAAAMIYNGVVCSLPQPARHGDIIAAIGRSVGEAQWPINGDDGFVTSEGRFVGRNDGIEIARAAVGSRCGGRLEQMVAGVED